MAKSIARRATPKETIEIGKLLTEHFDVENKKYHEGWDDARIVAVVSGDLSPKTAANVRKSLGMNIYTVARNDMGANGLKLREDVETLTAKVAKLEADVSGVLRAAANYNRAMVTVRVLMARTDFILNEVGEHVTLRGRTFGMIVKEAERRFSTEPVDGSNNGK